MAIAIVRVDLLNKRIYYDVDGGASTTRTVQQMGSLIKDELQRSPHIDEDKIQVFSGLDEFITGNFTGVVMKMQDGWEIWTEDQGSKHRFIITQGLIITEPAGGDPMGTPTNIVWSVAEQTVSALLASTGGATTLRSLDI